MTHKEHLKLELMFYGINHDYFGYGSRCYKRSDNKYIAEVDGERFVYTGKQLAAQWDQLDDLLVQAFIVKDYFKDEGLPLEEEK